MSQINSTRSGCKDVFHAFMVQNATYEGELEIPCIAPETAVPEKLISFSKAIGGTDYDAWVHFYEDDASFERLWNRPFKYLPILKRYKGVIAPDFSLYRDMPLVMQHWNIYRSHAVAVWLQSEGVPVIANVRWGDERTYTDTLLGEKVAFQGVDKHSIVSVGTYGQIQTAESKRSFREGLIAMLDELEPQVVLVYGSMPNQIFGGLSDRTKFVQFPDWTTRMKTTK